MASPQGSHPAIKLKKAVQLVATDARRPSQAVSTGSSGHLELPGFNPNRRRSTMYRPGMGLGISLALRRMTRANIHPDSLPKPVVKLENTYKLEPDNEFLSGKAKSRLEEVLEEVVGDRVYSAEGAGSMASQLAEAVKRAVKELGFSRHKLVTTVALGQCQGQGLEAASRCLWDDRRDNYATLCYQNSSLFAVVTVFAAYYE